MGIAQLLLRARGEVSGHEGAMKTLIFIILSIVSVAKAEVAAEVVVKPLPAEFQPLEEILRSLCGLL